MGLSQFKDIQRSIADVTLYQEVADGRKRTTDTCCFVLVLIATYALIHTSTLSLFVNPMVSSLDLDNFESEFREIFPKDLVVKVEFAEAVSEDSLLKITTNKAGPVVIPLPASIQRGVQMFLFPAASASTSERVDIDAVLPPLSNAYPKLQLATILPPSSAPLQDLTSLCQKHRSIFVVEDSEVVTCDLASTFRDIVPDIGAKFSQKSSNLEDALPSKTLLRRGYLDVATGEYSYKEWDYVSNFIFENLLASLLFRWKLLVLIIDSFIFIGSFNISLFAFFFSWILTAFLSWIGLLFLSFFTSKSYDFGTCAQLSVYAHTVNYVLTLWGFDWWLLPTLQVLAMGVFALSGSRR